MRGKRCGSGSSRSCRSGSFRRRFPAALRVLGITRYSEELEDAIGSGQLIKAGSPWEVEIRAHTIWACELLAQQINELRPPELQVIVPQVDARLWVPFHRTHYPHHLTRTIYY